jgi:hypothetical protein
VLLKRYENLGIYGWDVRAAISFTEARASARIAAHPPHDDLLGAKPDNDNDIAAASVLAPFGDAAAQLDAAASHGRDGGIGTLVVALGANNALGSVAGKRIAWTQSDYMDLDDKERYTVWNPAHLAAEYADLVRGILPIPARRLVLATVPRETIAPIAFGVNPDNPGHKWREGFRYFPYYTDPWIAEADFRPDKHRHITHQHARAIDSAIDQFNDVILDHVRRARAAGRDRCWTCAASSTAWPTAGSPPTPPRRHPISGSPTRSANRSRTLTPRFFRSDKTGRLQGGLFGLDAVHPTIVGYGLIAHAVLDLPAGTGVPVTAINFVDLLKKDTLNARPPALFAPLCSLPSPFLTRLARTQPAELRHSPE